MLIKGRHVASFFSTEDVGIHNNGFAGRTGSGT